MWSYYGAKTNVVDFYPTPKHDLIIEPFAGSARYSLKYFEKDVLLIDKYPTVIKIWEYLQQCSPNDILSLPNVGKGQTLNDFSFSCEAEKNLMGFIVQYGVASPGLTPSPSKLRNRSNYQIFTKERIAKNLFKIKHWKFMVGDYTESPDLLCTTFIDPPYQRGGHKYPMSNKKIDFKELSSWCMKRTGQVIVCENTNANWMPFIPLAKQRGSQHTTTEAIWTNEPTHYNNLQQQLF